MITIYDDTFSLNKVEYPLDFLLKDQYKTSVNIIEEVVGKKIKEEKAVLENSQLVACHKTLKFKSKDSLSFLSPELNAQIFENLEVDIRNLNIPYISFSGQITDTKIYNDKYLSMNKRDFYFNLKNLLDYYFKSGVIELKVLKYGLNFLGYELLPIQNNLFYIFEKYPEYLLTKDIIEIDKRVSRELEKYYTVSKIRPDFESWLNLIDNKYARVSDLKDLLNKITKSFLKYGKCIYNI